VKFDASEPGLVVSGAIHALLLIAALVTFTHAPQFQDASETAPVDLVTDQQFNQIMKGEKTAKQVLPKPTIRAEQKSDAPEPKPHPPVAEAKQDVPTPPPPQLRVKDPGEDDQPPTPPQTVTALPPDRPPDLTQPPAPTPPPRPQSATPPPPPNDAEAIDPPLPPERPKFEEAKETPQPPEDRPVPKRQEQLKPDQIAKLLERASRPRDQEDPSQYKDRMNPTEIAQLLSRDTPQERAATAQELSNDSSLGSETANAARMSPSLWGALDGILQEQYKRCWSYLGLDTEHRYVPQIKVEYTQDGSLASEPALLNPPSDPSLQSLADSAMRAVRECNPLKIPPEFAPYFDQWKARILRFDPEEMSG
jgi:colicin import membrane protein